MLTWPCYIHRHCFKLKYCRILIPYMRLSFWITLSFNMASLKCHLRVTASVIHDYWKEQILDLRSVSIFHSQLWWIIRIPTNMRKLFCVFASTINENRIVNKNTKWIVFKFRNIAMMCDIRGYSKYCWLSIYYATTYRKISNISRTKSQNLNDSRVVSRVAVVSAQPIETRWYVDNEDVAGAAPTGDQQFYCLLRCVLY